MMYRLERDAHGTATFELTKGHVKLLRRGYTEMEDTGAYWGVIGLDCKKPFGNRDITSDMAEILGLKRIEIDEGETAWPSGTTERMHRLYQELVTALEVVLRSGSFKPGTYEAKDCSSKWKLKKGV